MPNFTGWGQKRFFTWLLKHYPDPGTPLVQVTLIVHHPPPMITEFTMADTYVACINELAYELVMNEVAYQKQWSLLIRPAKRRKKKEMWAKFDKPPR